MQNNTEMSKNTEKTGTSSENVNYGMHVSHRTKYVQIPGMCSRSIVYSTTVKTRPWILFCYSSRYHRTWPWRNSWLPSGLQTSLLSVGKMEPRSHYVNASWSVWQYCQLTVRRAAHLLPNADSFVIFERHEVLQSTGCSVDTKTKTIQLLGSWKKSHEKCRSRNSNQAVFQ